LKSVKFFNGNPVFGIRIALPIVIDYYKKKYESKVEVDYFGERYKSDIWNITKYGTKWKPIVKLFQEKMVQVCNNGNNLWENRTLIPTKGKFHVQFPAIRGHGTHNNINKMLNDDFYTLIIKDSEKNKGIRNSKNIGNVKFLVYEFNTELEQNNFIEYCKTYFVRFCLSLYKYNKNLHRGELKLIPWLDFTQKWTDKKLFEYFNIDKKTQDYIYNYLPDYYGILKQ
jgi:hypothetical protein